MHEDLDGICVENKLRPRLVEARIGAAVAPVATVATVAFCLYLIIIVQTLTN